jgi:hypothetical protein
MPGFEAWLRGQEVLEPGSPCSPSAAAFPQRAMSPLLAAYNQSPGHAAGAAKGTPSPMRPAPSGAAAYRGSPGKVGAGHTSATFVSSPAGTAAAPGASHHWCSCLCTLKFLVCGAYTKNCRSKQPAFDTGAHVHAFRRHCGPTRCLPQGDGTLPRPDACPCLFPSTRHCGSTSHAPG